MNSSLLFHSRMQQLTDYPAVCVNAVVSIGQFCDVTHRRTHTSEIFERSYGLNKRSRIDGNDFVHRRIRQNSHDFMISSEFPTVFWSEKNPRVQIVFEMCSGSRSTTRSIVVLSERDSTVWWNTWGENRNCVPFRTLCTLQCGIQAWTSQHCCRGEYCCSASQQRK